MKGISRWDHQPYCRLTDREKARRPYICRLAPFEDGFAFDWFDRGASDVPHTVLYRERGSADPCRSSPYAPP